LFLCPGAAVVIRLCQLILCKVVIHDNNDNDYNDYNNYNNYNNYNLFISFPVNLSGESNHQ
jgi:hypothetical protein